MAAALGVVQDISNNTQKFFGGLEKDKMQKKYENHWPVHQDDIADLSVCQGQRNIVATGEVGKKSTIHVWDSNTLESLAQFNLGPEARGITSLSISPCARYVCCVDNSNDHNLTIYNINRKKQIL
jgi:WD40 repeat protein